MPKRICVQDVTFGATGMTYVVGQEYDVPADILKDYPDYFKQAGRGSNKMVATAEDKSADGAAEEVTEEAE